MITLYAAGPAFDLPEGSPYVTKTEIHLRLADIAYVKVPAMPSTSPKGQLPWIEDDGEKIADSSFIRAHIEARYGVDLDAGLTPAQRAQAWMIERMVENHLGWISAHFRYMIPENFEKGPAHWFDAVPEPMRGQLTADMLKAVSDNILAVGVGRHSEVEMLWLAARSFDALETQLGDQAFLFGDRETSADAIVFATLAGILTPFFNSPLRDMAEDYPTLVAYVGRMMARHYPEDGWKLAA